MPTSAVSMAKQPSRWLRTDSYRYIYALQIATASDIKPGLVMCSVTAVSIGNMGLTLGWESSLGLQSKHTSDHPQNAAYFKSRVYIQQMIKEMQASAKRQQTAQIDIVSNPQQLHDANSTGTKQGD